MLDAQTTEPTAAEMDAAIVFTADGYSDADGIDHVTAAHRALAAADDGGQLDKLEAELLAAEIGWHENADLTDSVRAEREQREVTAEDEAVWQAASDRHWAAVDALTNYIPRTPAELMRKATLLTNKGDTRLRADEQFADIYLRDAEAVARMVLAGDECHSDQISTWEARLTKTESACEVGRQSERFAGALALHKVLDGQRGEVVEAECEAQWYTMLAAEATAQAGLPVARAGVAFQLLCAVGDICVVESGVNQQAKDQAGERIRSAVVNAIAALSLPFDPTTAEYFLGNRLAKRLAR